MQGMPPVIQLKQAVFGQEDHPVVGPLDLVIHPGDKVLLEGPSGCGKTSVLRGILGFLRRLTGSYDIHGEPARHRAILRFRQETSYITQELMVGSGPVHAWLAGQSVSFHETDLTRFQLSSSILEQALDELSRGERQRLAIIVALARKPSIFLLDEITSALNDDLRALVVAHFSSLDSTVISVSHDDAWRKNGAFHSYPLPA
ncbi:MAG: putative ABC transport system ATP-binding protein [Verrucomicrobiales bacterium]|jgi:putative ABC transport system ATP-binding protein